MESIVISGLSAGSLTVILCTSSIMGWLRKLPYIKKPLACCLCTSFWCSLVFDPSVTVLATVAVANLTVMVIHWSMTTYSTDETDVETNPETDSTSRPD